MYPDSNLHYKALVIKTVSTGRKLDSDNETEKGTLIFNKDKNTQWEKDTLFNKWCWKN